MGRSFGITEFSLEQRELIVNDYIDNNLSYAQIHKKYGCSQGSVWRWCIQLGKRELLPFGNTKILKIKQACHFSYQQIIDYSIDRGWNFDEIVKNFELNECEEKNLKQYTVKHYGHDGEIKVLKKNGNGGRLMKKYKDQIIAFCDGTKTYIDICNEFGLPYIKVASLIYKIRHSYNIELPIKEVKRGPKSKNTK